MKNKTTAILLIIFLIVLNIAMADNLFPIYVRNRPANTIIEMEINYSLDSACSNILLSDVQNIAIDNKGVGFMLSNITSLTSTPSFICEYQDNVLTAVHQWNTINLLGLQIYFRDIFLDNTLLGILKLNGTFQTDKIGIGTAPSTELHVIGNTNTTGISYLSTIKQLDGIKHFFGTADDSSISYNGVNMIINPDDVGSGKLQISGDVLIAVSGTEQFKIQGGTDCGIVFTDSCSAGTGLTHILTNDNADSINLSAGLNTYISAGGTTLIDDVDEFNITGTFKARDNIWSQNGDIRIGSFAITGHGLGGIVLRSETAGTPTTVTGFSSAGAAGGITSVFGGTGGTAFNAFDGGTLTVAGGAGGDGNQDSVGDGANLLLSGGNAGTGGADNNGIGGDVIITSGNQLNAQTGGGGGSILLNLGAVIVGTIGEIILNGSLSQTKVIGNINVTGNITGNQIYGEMFNHTDIGNTVTISDSTTYFNITNLSADHVNGFSVSDSGLIPQVAGLYKFNWAVAFGNAGNNVEYQITLKINENIENECETHRKVGAAGDVGSASGVCNLQLAVNDEVRIGIKNIDGTQDAIMFNTMVNALRIGD